MFRTFLMRYKRFLHIFFVRGRNPPREIYFNESDCTLRFPVIEDDNERGELDGNDRLWPLISSDKT